MNETQRLFTVEGAAKYLVEIGAAGVGVHFVRQLIVSGAIPHVRMGRRYYITRAALDEWLLKHERRAR
jgi:excisionase family DNA binding protein